MVIFKEALPVGDELREGVEGPSCHSLVPVHHATLGAVQPGGILDVLWVEAALSSI